MATRPPQDNALGPQDPHARTPDTVASGTHTLPLPLKPIIRADAIDAKELAFLKTLTTENLLNDLLGKVEAPMYASKKKKSFLQSSPG